jgi:hypothetical protein
VVRVTEDVDERQNAIKHLVAADASFAALYCTHTMRCMARQR